MWCAVVCVCVCVCVCGVCGVVYVVWCGVDKLEGWCVVCMAVVWRGRGLVGINE